MVNLGNRYGSVSDVSPEGEPEPFHAASSTVGSIRKFPTMTSHESLGCMQVQCILYDELGHRVPGFSLFKLDKI